MPYEPSRGGYRYIDEDLTFNTRSPQTTRTAQVLPRKNYDPAQLARAARHQARIEAKQRNHPLAPTHTAPPDDCEDDASIDGDGDVWSPPMPTVTRTYQVGTNGVPLRQTRIDHYHQTPFISQRQLVEEREVAEPRYKKRLHVHWLVFVGVGLLLMIAGWIAFNDLGLWWQTHQDEGMFIYPGHLKTVIWEHHSHEETARKFEGGFSYQSRGLLVKHPGIECRGL